jgi:hypothetical protein
LRVGRHVNLRQLIDPGPVTQQTYRRPDAFPSDTWLTS